MSGSRPRRGAPGSRPRAIQSLLCPQWPGASLLSRSSIAGDTLPPSRLAPGQFERNECIVISETPHQRNSAEERQKNSDNATVAAIVPAIHDHLTCHAAGETPVTPWRSL